MKSEKVGIVLAFYNPKRALFLGQLNSIVNQSYTNWFCVICVDGDRDNLLQDEVIGSLLESGKFTVKRGLRRLGFVGNFGEGLGLLLQDKSIDYFVFSDQDDEWFPNMIEIQVSNLSDKPKGSLVFSDLAIQKVLPNGNKEVVETSIWAAEKRNVESRDTESVLMRNLVSGASGMFDRSLAEDFAPIPSWVRFHDHYFAVCATLKGGLYPIPISLYIYNQHGDNVVGGSSYKGFLSVEGQSKSKLNDKYQYLSSWKKRVGLRDLAFLNIFRFSLIFKDPSLYRSHLAYFLGKYFG